MWSSAQFLVHTSNDIFWSPNHPPGITSSIYRMVEVLLRWRVWWSGPEVWRDRFARGPGERSSIGLVVRAVLVREV
jgi:hypothetical protein